MRIVKPSGIARARGILAPGFAVLAAFWVCQKMAGRPRVSVKTNCERARRGSVEHQVDNRTATAYEGNASLLYDLGDIGPVGLVGMTVDPGRARPGVTGLEHQTTLNRQAQQVGQLAVFLGVEGDQEDGPCHRLKPPGIR